MPALRWWSQLPFGWVCFSNIETADVIDVIGGEVSIAFRLGLFL